MELKKLRNQLLKELFSAQKNGVWPDVDPDAMGIITGARAGLHPKCAKWIVDNQNEDGGWDEIDPYYEIPQLRTLLTIQALNTAKILNLKIDHRKAYEFLGENCKRWKEDNSFMRSRGRMITLKVITEIEIGKKLDTQLPSDEIYKSIFGHWIKKKIFDAILNWKHEQIKKLPFEMISGACCMYDYECVKSGGVASDFLINGQLENGSWCGFIDSTWLGSISHKNGSEKAKKWLSSIGGLLPHVYPFEIWNAVLPFYLFDKIGLNLITPRTIKWIKSSQHKNGGWGWTRYIPFPDLDCTALSTYMLRNENYKKHFTKAIDYMISYASKNGGFPSYAYSPNELSIDVTARVLENLDLNKYEDIINKTIKYLIKNQQINGCWEGNWNLSNIHTTSQVLISLKRFKETKPIEKGIEYLIKTQKDDGSWGTPEETGYAIIALNMFNIGSDNVKSGLNYLCNIFPRWMNKKMWVAVSLYSTDPLKLSPIISAIHSSLN